MNENKDVKAALQKEKDVGTHVIYVKNGNLDKWLDAGQRKDIWVVVACDGGSNLVRISNAVNPDNQFETPSTNLISMFDVDEIGLAETGYLTPRSYKYMTEYLAYGPWDDEIQNYKKDDPYKKARDAAANVHKNYATGNTIVNYNIDSQTYSDGTTKSERIDKMRNSKLDTILEPNADAAKVAARITLGKTINKVMLEKVRPQLPLMVRGYSEHALAEVVVANLCSFAVQNFAAGNVKAQYAAKAMMEAAMVEFMSQFNIDKIISEVLSGVDLPEVE